MFVEMVTDPKNTKNNLPPEAIVGIKEEINQYVTTTVADEKKQIGFGSFSEKAKQVYYDSFNDFMKSYAYKCGSDA